MRAVLFARYANIVQGIVHDVSVLLTVLNYSVFKVEKPSSGSFSLGWVIKVRGTRIRRIPWDNVGVPVCIFIKARRLLRRSDILSRVCVRMDTPRCYISGRFLRISDSNRLPMKIFDFIGEFITRGQTTILKFTIV